MGRKKLSATETILQSLRENIVNCEYDARDIITEQAISERFGVSKTPAREALNYLCVEGLLEKLPHKGYLVKEISVQETKSLLQFRYILESAVIKIVTLKASEEEIHALQAIADYRIPAEKENFHQKYRMHNLAFHIALAETAKNSYLTASLRNVLTLLERAMILDGKRGDFNALLAFHSELLNLIAKRDLTGALNLNRNMNEASGERILLGKKLFS